MTRFLDRIASLPILFLSGACEAQMIMVPCDRPIAAMAPIHFAHHTVKRHVAHRGGRRGVIHALHLVSGRAMCAVWLGAGSTNANLPDDFNRAYGGGYFEESADTDLGGEEGAGSFGGAGGSGGSDTPPGLIYLTPHDTPPVTPIEPVVPITPIAPAVPEPSTVLMLLMGMASLGFWHRTKKEKLI